MISRVYGKALKSFIDKVTDEVAGFGNNVTAQPLVLIS